MGGANIPKSDFGEIPGGVIIGADECAETFHHIKNGELGISAVSEDGNIILVTNRHVGDVYIKTPEGMKVLQPNWKDESKNSVRSRGFLAADAVVTIDGVAYVFNTGRHIESFNLEDFFFSRHSEAPDIGPDNKTRETLPNLGL